MSVLAIFLMGLLVTAITSAAALLVGLDEAADPIHSRQEDLTEFEKRVVGRSERARAS